MLDFAILLVAGFILWKVHVMGAELERLRLEVEQQESAIESAITLINGLSAALRTALTAGDTAAIAELADRLDASGTKLATAVAANTAADDDSDSFYDGEPIDDGTSEGNGNGSLFDQSDESVQESTTERAGEGVTGVDSAEDTSATTTQPVYDDAGAGNGDSSGQPSTGSTTGEESSGSSEAESSDSSDENGPAAA